jgi:hypothetical protein
MSGTLSKSLIKADVNSLKPGRERERERESTREKYKAEWDWRTRVRWKHLTDMRQGINNMLTF